MKRQASYRIKIETRYNGEVWYTPQVQFRRTWFFGMITTSPSWQSIYKCPTGGYDYSDSLTVSHRNEEDAMVAIKGLKLYLSEKMGGNVEQIDYKYF